MKFLEKQIKSLPPQYYNELVDYLEYLLSKAEKMIRGEIYMMDFGIPFVI
ncbi:MAG: DUF2281 domain-containing protein [Treponema sp.]|nr:DUF2281 domain-containing protein [Treponema sp.]